jgi:superfamily II DNA/RNA helicase
LHPGATGLSKNKTIIDFLIVSLGMNESIASNYDVPGFVKTYVHRCGRTARAGKTGEVISLLKGSGQAGQFTKLRQ